MTETYLSHHGIKGQKHGVRNGPPYPLDYKQLSPEEKAKAKSKAIETGNIEEADKNVEEFTNKEIQDVIDRYMKKAQLHKFTSAELARGKRTIESIVDKGYRFVDLTNTGMAVWNNVAKITNTVNKGFTGQEGKLPIIQGVPGAPTYLQTKKQGK